MKAVGYPHGNEYESCSRGRARAGGNPAGPHLLPAVPLVMLPITWGGCFPAYITEGPGCPFRVEWPEGR